MLSSIFNPSSSLSLTLIPDIIFLHPPPIPKSELNNTDDPTNLPPSDDPILRGTADLHLTKPRYVQEVQVRLRTVCNLYFPDGSGEHQVPLLEKELVVSVEKELEAGDHSFVFSFIIPSTSAPYERCTYGRIWSKVSAIAKCSGMSSNLTASAPFDLIANPSREGEPPTPTVIQVGEFTEDLGIFTLRYNSPNLTVAGLLHTEFCLTSPPNPIRIEKINISIQQNQELKPLKISKSEPIKIPLKTKTLLSRGFQKFQGDNLEEIKKKQKMWDVQIEKEWSFREWCRLPDDDMIRPTTLPGTETPIKTSSSLLFELIYRRLDDSGVPHGETKVMSVAKKVTISSCCCLMESLTLPPYTPSQSPSPSPSSRFSPNLKKKIEKVKEKDKLKRGGCVDVDKCSTMDCQCGATFISLMKSDMTRFFVDELDGRGRDREREKGRYLVRTKWDPLRQGEEQEEERQINDEAGASVSA